MFNKLEKEMYKANINEAVFTVLTTKYKKEAEEAFKLVKEAGYEYSKNNGRFDVYNPQTGRRIYLTEGRYRRSEITVHTGIYLRQSTRFKKEADIKVIDFVNCLEKSENTEFYRVVEGSKAVSTYYHKIRQPKRMAESYANDIEQYQRQIEELQEQIVKAAQHKAEYEMEVAMAKKELGI